MSVGMRMYSTSVSWLLCSVLTLYKLSVSSQWRPADAFIVPLAPGGSDTVSDTCAQQQHEVMPFLMTRNSTGRVLDALLEEGKLTSKFQVQAFASGSRTFSKNGHTGLNSALSAIWRAPART